MIVILRNFFGLMGILCDLFNWWYNFFVLWCIFCFKFLMLFLNIWRVECVIFCNSFYWVLKLLNMIVCFLLNKVLVMYEFDFLVKMYFLWIKVFYVKLILVIIKMCFFMILNVYMLLYCLVKVFMVMWLKVCMFSKLLMIGSWCGFGGKFLVFELWFIMIKYRSV